MGLPKTFKPVGFRPAIFRLGFGVAVAALLLGCGTSPEPKEKPAAAQAATAPAVVKTEAAPPTDLKPSGTIHASDESSRDALTTTEYYTGSGEMTLDVPGSGPELAISDQGQVALNFVDADIREVIDVVLGDTLGVNYVVDPQVQGTVTLRTSQPLPKSAILPTLENVLKLNHVSLIESGGLFSVVPSESAAGLTSSVVSSGARAGAAGFGIHVIPLKYVSVSSLREVLHPFVGAGRSLSIDEARNVMIFSGSAQEARDLEELAMTFDVDWMQGMSFAIIPVEIANAKTMVADLEAVFGQDQAGPLKGVVRFLPIERLNAVLAISPQPSYLARAEQWVERLDRGDEAAGRRIYVYYVKNGRAVELAEILSAIFDSGDSGRDSRGGVAPGLTAVSLVGERDRAILEAELEEAVNVEGVPEAPRARGAIAEALVTGTGINLGQIVSEGGDIRVIADERNNALVFLATAGEFRMIESTLKRLDIIPLQVMIEATIAEVGLNDTLEYGLQWFFENGDVTGFFSSGASQLIQPAVPGFNFLLQTGNARVVLNALAEITEVNVISSPLLMVLDNQTARLQVGDQVPIATQSSTATTDPDAPIVNTIELRDTGVILEVTPRVNASGLVVMDIIQEVSDVIETTTSSIDSPTIQQRLIQSTVAVQSGMTVALGGLIRDRTEESESGLPLLSQIPILGNLFKTTSDSSRRTELMILITPRIVRNQNEAKEVTDELRRRMSNVVPLELEIL
jgi:general secretion pathway protein D